MKNPLNKRIPRILKKDAAKYIGIFLILVSIIMVGSSFMSVMESSKYTLEDNDRECLIEDGQFEIYSPISDEVIKEFRDNGIDVAENFYVSINDFDGNARFMVFNERTKMNLPSIFEGRLPENENEIAVERLFAKNRKIAVGDEISYAGVSFTVVGTISIPDYNALFKSNQDLVMNVNDFGLAVVKESGFERLADISHTYRYSYRFEDRSLDKTAERNKVETIQRILVQNGAVIQSFLTFEQNQSINLLREDMGKDGPMMQVFIYILIMVVAFVFAILTANTIESEAPIIGTLRAMGYTKWEIVWHYLSPTVIITLLGSAVGNILGYTAMIEPFKNMYYNSYSIAPLQVRFNVQAFVMTTIIPVVIMILINMIMLCNKLSLSPLKFLRKDLNKRKQKRAAKLPNVSFMSRFRMRVLIQNKVSYLILFIGIFISSFLLMFGLGLGPLVDHYVDEIDDSLTYEYQYILKTPIEVDKGEKLETYSLKTWYEFGKKDMDVSFMGVEDNTEFFPGLAVPDNEGEIVISEPLAEKLGVKAGEVLTFKDDYYEKEYELRVAGIYDYKGSLTAFMSREMLNRLLGNGRVHLTHICPTSSLI